MTNAGDALGPWSPGPVSAERMRVLAEVLDDPNPIHLDRAAVAELGLGDRLINQGPAGMGYVLSMLLEAFPGARVAAVDVRFLATVLEDDRVTAAGRVEAVEGSRVTCAVWLEVDGGARALEGQATIDITTRSTDTP